MLRRLLPRDIPASGAHGARALLAALALIGLTAALAPAAPRAASGDASAARHGRQDAADTAAAGAARDWPIDPIFVYYPRASCRGDAIALEVWDRDAHRWRPHPVHPSVPVESCQLEDAGVLWNEIRWKCIEPPGSVPPPAWVQGLEIFDPRVMERCSAARAAGAQGELEIRVTAPREGERVRSAEPRVPLEGVVLLDGLQGAEYDVAIAIDVSDAERLREQVAAARTFVRSNTPRLGDARIAILSHPNLRPRRGESTAARLESGFEADPEHLDRVLAGLARRGATGSTPDAVAALSFALDVLTRDAREAGGARPAARKLVLLSADGARARLFGPADAQDAALRERFHRAIGRARAIGAALHFFALGGTGELQTLPAQALAGGLRGSFTRVRTPAADAGHLLTVRLPFVTDIGVFNQSTGERAERLRASRGGAFRARVPVAPGVNHVAIEARSSDGRRVTRDHVIDFDDSLIRERLRAAERERIEAIRRGARKGRGRVRVEAEPDAPPPTP